MSPDLDQLLCERYPKIFADRLNPDSCMSRGFECGDGWFTLIDRLCFRVQAAVTSGERPPPVALQMKEKLGGLRFYWLNADAVISELTYLAGDLSEISCEVCGAPGERVQSLGSAVMVRCPLHWHQQVAGAAGSELAQDEPQDELFERAAEIVVGCQSASVSLLQRHLKLGYQRACRLVTALELAQVITTPSADGSRRVLRQAFPPEAQ